MKKIMLEALELGLTLAVSAIGSSIAEPIGYAGKIIFCPMFREAEEAAAAMQQKGDNP